jgi:hypothetical protein
VAYFSPLTEFLRRVRARMKRAVLVSLVLMAAPNFSFAALAAAGHSNLGLAGAIGFENFASGIGGVTVVAYLSALCKLRFTATQYALLSAAASVAGRFLTGTTACPRCDGRMRLVALIQARAVIERILPHLGQSIDLPRLRPSRDPPPAWLPQDDDGQV